MPVYQEGQNVKVAIKRQAGLGTPATGGSGAGVRIAEGTTGLRLLKTIVESSEIRSDGQSSRGRHGSKSGTSAYQVELSVGTLDEILEAALRGTWTSALSITEVAMTSITTVADGIIAAAGSWLTQGVRRGDMVKLTGHSTAANNGKWLRVLGVTAAKITVPTGDLAIDAVADTAFTLTVAKTLICGSTPTERYHTIDEHNQTIDMSLVGTDFKISRIEISCQPGRPIMVAIQLMGLDVAAVSGASAPTLTAPVYTTTIPLVISDGTIRINGTDYADLTSFTLVFDLAGNVPQTLSATAPDVFLSNARMSGTVAGLRKDSTSFLAFRNETTIEFFLVAKEPESDPADFVSIYVGNAVYDGNDGPIGGNGPISESIPWRAGKDEAGSDHAATMLKFATSAA